MPVPAMPVMVRWPIAALALALGSLAACGARPGAVEAPPVSPEAAIAIETMDAEVWAFEYRVAGTADPACRAVEVAREGGPSVEAVRTARRFAAEVPLVSGENRIVARCELSGGRVIASAPLRLEVPIEDRPRARIAAEVADGAIVLDLGASAPAEGTPAELASASWRVVQGPALVTRAGEPLERARGMRVELEAPRRDGEYVVEATLRDALGRADRAGVRFVVEGGAARVPDPMREQARWIDPAVIYGAVPFLFGRPGLPAITLRLDALAALGVDTIWLAPITDSPDDDYGYAVRDYFTVRPAYGTREDLRALVDAAHARGMRVVMDFVPNHTSDRHRYFEHAQRYGRRSPYWGFYDRDESGRPTHYFDWENLPNLDYDQPQVRRWMREAFSFWVRELDVDGFRVDAAWGVQRRAPAFFPALAEELYRIDPQLLLIAEASARDPYWREVGFAAAYDWTEELGHWAWREAMGAAGDEPGIDVCGLRDAIVATERATEAGGPRVVRFLDNNDTGARFVTRHGRGAHDAASALLMTLPGLPALFTGDEIGAEYEPYGREEPLDWRPSDDVGRELARRIELRRRVPVLHEGELMMLDVDPEDAVLAFLRRDPEGEHAPALVVIELRGEAVRATVQLPADAQRALGLRAWRDALEGEPVAVERRAGRVEVPLEAFGARVFVGAN